MASPAVLGTIAGDLETIAGQLALTASNLKQLGDEFAALPDRVLDVADTIEGLGLLLLQTGRQLPSTESCHPSILQKSISIWKRHAERVAQATRSLRVLADDGSDDTSRFDASDIEQLCDSLEKSREQIESAYQLFQNSRANTHTKQVTYTGLSISGQARVHAGDVYYNLSGISATRMLMANTQNSAERITPAAARIASTGTTQCPSQKSIAPGSSSFPTGYNKKLSPCAPKSRSYRTKLKPWFLPWIWDMSLQRAATGWDIQLRTYNVVPEDSPIFQFIRNGDIDRVEKIMRLNMASPYDQSENGTSVAEIAIESRGSVLPLSSNVVYQLINPRTRVDIVRSQTPEESSYVWCKIVTEQSNIYIEERYEHWDLESLKNQDAARLMVRDMSTEYGLLSTREKLDLTFNFVHHFSMVYSPSFVMKVLQCTEVDEALAHTLTEYGLNLVHMLPYLMRTDQDCATLINFVRQLHQAGANFNHLTRIDGQTPMMIWACEKSGDLVTWARILLEAGVDLLSYAERERSCWERTCVSRGCAEDVEHMYTFSYGPAPSDWKLHRYLCIWIPMFERKHLSIIPGSWPKRENLYVPEVICWDPYDTDHERDEGDWERLPRIQIIKEVEEDDAQPVQAKIGRRQLQDDHGRLCLQLLRTPHIEHHRARSYSQPDFRALESHRTGQNRAQWQPYGRFWCSHHRCTLGSRPRTVITDRIDPSESVVRHCIQEHEATSIAIDKASGDFWSDYREEAEKRRLERYIDEEYARRFPDG